MQTTLVAAAIIVVAGSGCAGRDLPQDRPATSGAPAEAVRATEADTTVVVTGKTVIAYFPKVTQQEMDKDETYGISLDDMQYGLRGADAPLRRLGVAVTQVYANKFVIVIDGERHIFAPDSSHNVGYVIAAPKRSAIRCNGVMTDVDLVDAVAAYFKGIQADSTVCRAGAGQATNGS